MYNQRYYNNQQPQREPPQVYYNDKPATVYDPISDIFVDQNSDRGRMIKRYNDLCEKCGVSEVFVTAENKCKSIKNKSVLKKYEDEINYCKKYNKKIRKLVKTESKILENILNIKLPGGKGLLKDYVPKIPTEPTGLKKISKNTGVKDTLLSKIINFSPVIVFTIYKLAAENPELAKFAAKKAIEIISDSKGAIGSFFTKTILKNINFGSMKTIVSGLSFSKFLQFFTGLAVVISNFSFEKNKKTSENIQKTQVFEEFVDNYSSSIFDGDIVKINVETLDPASLYDLENSGLLTGKNRDSVSLSTLGIKSQDVVKATKQTRNPSLNISKAGISIETGMPFVVLGSNMNGKIIEVLPVKDRKRELQQIRKNLVVFSDRLSYRLKNTEKKIDAIRAVNILNSKKSSLSLINQSASGSQKRSKKEIKKENKLNRDIKEIESKIAIEFGTKKNKNWAFEQYETNNISDLENSKRTIVRTKDEIKKLLGVLENINDDNYNYYRNEIKNVKNLEDTKDVFIKRVDVPKIVSAFNEGSLQKDKQKIQEISLVSEPEYGSRVNEMNYSKQGASSKGNRKIEVISPKTNGFNFQGIDKNEDQLDSSKISDLLSKIIINKKN